MEFLTDWKLWLFVLTILGIGFNFFSHQKLVGNDLKHLAADIKDVIANQNKTNSKVDALAVDVAYLKGKQDGKDLK